MSFVRSLARLRKHSTGSRPEWIIAGLGNPGTQYAKSRHNIGFMCTNRLAQRAHVRFNSSSRDRADIAEAMIGGVSVELAQPQTYMNESGVAIAWLCRHFNLTPDRVLVIYDDVDLPFGSVRIRASGSSGGHRGIESVIRDLHTTDIPRIRVGIGRGQGPTKAYVLTEFAADERRKLTALCDFVSDVAEMVVAEGVIGAMNRYNGLEVPGVTAS